MVLPIPRIGPTIARLRKARGWTQAELAARMQVRGHETVEQPRITDIEKDRRDVTYRELVSLARIFDIPITELLGVKDYDPEDK